MADTELSLEDHRRQRHSEEGASELLDDPDEKRSRYQRDRDRILYAPEFRRLSGVSQVAAVDEIRLLHNRSAHSVKAAQLGRRIAERLIDKTPKATSFLSPDVVEAACLAHDLGHPPFGHVGERELKRLLQPIGGFEGNAQTLRILTKLSVKKDGRGLDLTRAALNAVIKYPLVGVTKDHSSRRFWTDRRYGTKRGVYETENETLQWCRKKMKDSERTPEATLMDWADDVTYAVHDLEDFYQSGLVPLDRFEQVSPWVFAHLMGRAKGWKGFSEHEAREAQGRLLPEFLWMRSIKPYEDSIEGRELLRKMVSGLLTRYEAAVSVSANSVKVDEGAQYEVALLKELTRYFVLGSPPLRLKERGQVHVLRQVFFNLWDLILSDDADPPVPPPLRTSIDLAKRDAEGAEVWEEMFSGSDDHGSVDPRAKWRTLLDDEDDESTKHFYRTIDRAERAVNARALGDYLSSLTENQVLDLFARLTHARQVSMFGAWF